MHAENFLHRDIAPDNIIVRADGTPGAARFRRRAPRRRRDEPHADRHRQGRLLAARAVLLRQPPAGALVGPLRARRHALPRRHRAHARGSHAARRRGPHAAGGAGRARARTGRASSPPSTPASRSGTRSGRGPWRSCGRCCSTQRHRQSASRSRPRRAKPVSGPTSTRKVSTLRPAASGAPAPLAGRGGSRCWPSWAAPTAASNTCAGSRPGPARRLPRPSARLRDRAGASRLAAADAARRQEEATAAAQRQAELDAERRRQEEAAAAGQRQADLDAERRRQEAAEAAAASQRQAELEAERGARTRWSASPPPTPRAGSAEEGAERPGRDAPRSTRRSAPRSCARCSRCSRRAAATTAPSTAAAAATRRRPWTISSPAAGKKGKTKPARIELAKATGRRFRDLAACRWRVQGRSVRCQAKASKRGGENAASARRREQPATTATGYSQTPGPAIGKWRSTRTRRHVRRMDVLQFVVHGWRRSQMHADTRWAQVRLALRASEPPPAPR